MKLERTYSHLAEEWNEIALERYEDLIAGKDTTYDEILRPKLLNLILDKPNISNVLDVGCGVGVLTEELSKYSQRVKAIDISSTSIEIAKSNSKNVNIEYECVNFFDFNPKEKFSVIVSNMTLMNIPVIEGIFLKIKDIMNENGAFIFTITHPAFWPMYWNYNGQSFDYGEEVEIVREFKTRSKIYTDRKTRHYHRPLEYYINLIIASGLTLSKFTELKDENRRTWYPRFLLFECKK